MYGSYATSTSHCVDVSVWLTHSVLSRHSERTVIFSEATRDYQPIRFDDTGGIIRGKSSHDILLEVRLSISHHRAIPR